MPKLKTHRAAAKRFSLTKTGKVKRLKLNDPILETGEWIGQNIGKMIYNIFIRSKRGAL